MVGIPTTDAYEVEHGVGVLREGWGGRLARQLARMPDNISAAPSTTESLGQRTRYLERVRGTDMSWRVCKRAGNGAKREYKHLLGLSGAENATLFFQKDCST